MSGKLKDLREKRGRLVAESRRLLETAESEKRKLTDDESAQWEALMDDIEQTKREIDREERQIDEERQAAQLVDPRAGHPGEEGGVADAVSDELRMQAFRRALVSGPRALTHDELRALSYTTDSAGGYLSPPEQFVQRLIQAVDDMVFMRPLATTFQVPTAHSLGVPSLENDPADSNWTAELTSVTEDSTMSFGKRELMPHLMTKLLKVSMKLLNSSALPAETIVRDRLAYKVAITQEKGFLTGSGASQPLGVFTASDSGIGTGRDVSTGNTSSSMTTDGLLEAKYTLKGNYWGRAQWIFHRDGVKQVAKLKDGEGQYLWQPSVQVGQPDRLMGFPVNMSEYAPNTFTTGQYVGLLGDFRYYWIADAMGMTIQRLDELYAATNQVGFISRMESDGAPVLAEAFVRVKLG